ncbi:MAG: hypothetical protein ABEJ03_01520 [Candidatus Nanohaloarchaea archaeon]
MASYKILPLRDDGIDLEKIQNRVENMSALESSEKLRSGTLPRSFQAFRGEMCYVEYAQEEETEVTTLEGDDETIKVADMYPIIFLGNGYVAYDANLPNQDVESDVVRMVSNLLDTDIHYEPVTFDEDDLEDVVEQANKVREADFAPTSREPKSVSARHLPGLQETDFWQQYEKEPLEKARVDLPDQSTYNVSFYEKGKVTVHGQQIPPDVQVDVLRYITDEVVSNLDIDSFQKKLGGDYR